MNALPSPRPLKRGRLFPVGPAALLLFLILPVTAFAASSAGRKPAAPSSPGPGSATIVSILRELPAWGVLATPTAPFDANEQEYVLLGFGRQGFQQTTGTGAPWTLSLPAPTIMAQVFKRAASPENVTKDVRISWELEQGTQTDPKNAALRGDMVPAADGLSFTAEIPATARRTDGVVNPYPVVRLTAMDAGTNKVLAQSAVVVAVSPGFGCIKCHDGPGRNFLELHDKRRGTTMYAASRKGTVANCRSCHADDGSGKAGIGISASLHGRHTPQLAGKSEDACLSCHIGLGRSPSDGDSPPRHLFARGLHTDRGLTCVSCHGTMEDHALGLLRAEKTGGPAKALMAKITPRAVKSADEIAPRRAWVQQPDCAACHDFASKPRLDASAFNSRTKDAAGLYAMRMDDTGSVMCAACHGAPHAQYPARNPIGRDRDNIVPIQYQQHARALGAAGNCALCHMQSMDAPAHHPLVERERTKIQLPAEVKSTLPLVTVSHRAHAALDCKACHHTGREDGKSMSCTRAGCHDRATAPSSDGKGTVTDPLYFRNAFHGPGNSCFSCHAEAQKTGKPGGPTACKDCHTAPSPRWDAEAAPMTGEATTPTPPAEASPTTQATPQGEAPAREGIPRGGAPTQEGTTQAPALAGRNGTR